MEFLRSLKQLFKQAFDYKSASQPREFWFGVAWLAIITYFVQYGVSFALWNTGVFAGFAYIAFQLLLPLALSVLGLSLVARRLNYQGHSVWFVIPLGAAMVLDLMQTVTMYFSDLPSANLDAWNLGGLGFAAKMLVRYVAFALTAWLVVKKGKGFKGALPAQGAAPMQAANAMPVATATAPRRAAAPAATGEGVGGQPSAQNREVRYCTNCGDAADEGAFCKTCGTPLA